MKIIGQYYYLEQGDIIEANDEVMDLDGWGAIYDFYVGRQFSKYWISGCIRRKIKRKREG